MTDSARWHSRGYLPHFDSADTIQTLTFRLDDALPRDVAVRLERLGGDFGQAARRKAIEACLDRGFGRCWLSNEAIAQMVERALLHFDGQRYRLFEWVIMPNHVHALVQRWLGWELEKVLHSWKSWTSKQAGKILGIQGKFWQKETFDRFIRNEEHFRNAVEYIRQNPVKAHLVACAEDWPYGSASRMRR